jgi:chromosome segregation ATPase
MHDLTFEVLPTLNLKTGQPIDRSERELELEAQNKSIRQRMHEQRRELRRLNQSIIDKLHRLQLAQARLERLEQALEGAGIRVTFEF